MQIIRFLFANAVTHLGKSIGFFTTIILLTVLSVGIFFAYKNIESAVTYYSTSTIVDTHRVEITADSNLFTLFSRETGGINIESLEQIQQDSDFHTIEIFTLIEHPVLAKFSLFSFGLETDIPVFALSGGSLKQNEIGISRKMLDYYNVQFAGSAIMFPEMNETFLMGQEVVVTVGGSKLFYVSTPPASPIYGRITSIHPDYPGFGLVLREDDLKSRLSEIGQSLGNPYKVTAYMKSGIATSTLKERYKNLHLNFDKDKIEQLQKKLHTITYAFLVIFFFIGGIIFTIIVFLLGGIFRESSSIYRMMNTFGITTIKGKILTLGEPIFLTLLGILGGWVVNSICMHFLTVYTSGFLTGKGIIFPFISISTIEIGIIIFFIFIILIGILLFLDKKARKKTI